MSLPIVAIVGRPNVGKSSLLNALVGKRVSIVDPTPGVTRDRVSAICEIDDSYFEIVDTGGYGIDDKDRLTDKVEAQIGYAVQSAAIILFVVDIHDEITPLDQEVARLLRQRADAVMVVANKADVSQHESAAGGLVRLGYGEALCVSALHGRGLGALKETIVERIGRSKAPPAEPVMKLAIVGRQNVGKSTFINGLAEEERVIVSEVPGTTRDSIDVRFVRDGRTFLAIDTAGIRKKAKRDKIGIDYYSFVRATDSIRRADVVLFLLDATQKITEVDKKLARLLIESFKPTVIVINKWDLAKGKAGGEDYADYLAHALPGLSFAPLAFTTATAGRNLHSTIEVAQALFKQGQQRVTTGQLNRAIEYALAERQPKADHHGAAPKIYYATQISSAPPTIVLFCNSPALVREDYRRFMARRLSEALPFKEIPIRLVWRARKSRTSREPERVPTRPARRRRG